MISQLLYYLFIFPLQQILSYLLEKIYWLSSSYGISIILLSLIVNLFILKLFVYTDKKAKIESNKKKELDSRIKAWKSVSIKKAKLYAFTRTLYSQKHYHPILALSALGGLALQIPFFYAMYFVIKDATFLENTSFLWIEDLTKSDNIAGIHLLPILMSIITLLNVFISTKERGARIQGIIITLLFLALLYNMPSALVLYWTSNTIFSLIKSVVYKYKERREAKEYSSLGMHSADLLKFENSQTISLASLPKSSKNIESHTANIIMLGESLDSSGMESLDSKIDSTSLDSRLDSGVESALDTKSTKEDSNFLESLESNKDSTNLVKSNKSYKSLLIKAKSLLNPKYILESIFTSYSKLDSKDYKLYRNISILVILNISFMIFVFSPFALYSSDVSQFDSTQVFNTLAGLFGYFMLTSFILIYATSFFYKSRLLKLGVYGFSVILLIGVVYSFILVGDYGAMDNFVLQSPTFLTPNRSTYITTLVVSIISGIIALIFLKRLYIVWKILFITMIALSFVNIYNILVEYNASNNVNAPTDIAKPYEKELFSYSKNDKNIVVILLDMFSGSHLPYILKQFPEFNTDLDGFTFFPNTISTTTSTIHSVATLIGGEYYAVYNMNKRKENLERSINTAFASIGELFADSGYNVAYNTEARLLHIATYANNKIFVLRGEEQQVFQNYMLQHANLLDSYKQAKNKVKNTDIVYLLSYGLFRFLPESYFRSKIYNKGTWLVDSKVLSSAIRPFQRSVNYYALTHILNTDSSKPTFKFMHYSMTHTPYGIYYNKGKCEFFSNKTVSKVKYFSKKSAKIHYQQYDTEACALSYLKHYIQMLKDAGIYDNTQIFVVSDHGGNVSVGMSRKRADALLLFKDFNAKGKLKTDSRLMANYDIPSIFCENLANGCPKVPKNILKHYPKNRELIHTIPISWMLGKHKSDEWILKRIYKVRGNAYEKKNWTEITKQVKDGTLIIKDNH